MNQYEIAFKKHKKERNHEVFYVVAKSAAHAYKIAKNMLESYGVFWVEAIITETSQKQLCLKGGKNEESCNTVTSIS